MSWLLMADGLDPDAVSTVSDWVKIGAGGLTIGGLLWACIYVARLIWQTFVQNMLADNKRLRDEMSVKDERHRIELDARDLLISKRDDLIDRLRKDIRKLDDETDKVEDNNRELRFENARLRDREKGAS